MKIKKAPILHLLKEKKYLPVFLFVAGGLFGLSYYIMATLPGERDLMCMIGADLTGVNITFSLFMSMATALIVVGLVKLISQKAATSSIKLGSISMIGLIAGMLTTFCTLCTLPVISLLGLSIGLGFFTEYEIHFKIISLFLLSLSLYFVNRQLKGGCLLGCKI